MMKRELIGLLIIFAFVLGTSSSSPAVTAVSGQLDVVKDDCSGAVQGSMFQMYSSAGITVSGLLGEGCSVTGGRADTFPLNGRIAAGRGVSLDAYQYDDTNSPSGGGYTGIVASFAFFGQAVYLNTSPIDYQTGSTVAAPHMDYDEASCGSGTYVAGSSGSTGIATYTLAAGQCPLISNLTSPFGTQTTAWDVSYGIGNFNQGSPKPDGTFPSQGVQETLKPTGYYGTADQAFKVYWQSLIVGGGFNGFTGHWQLAGTVQTHTPIVTSTITNTSVATNTNTPTSTDTNTSTVTNTNTITSTSTPTPTGAITLSGTASILPDDCSGTTGSFFEMLTNQGDPMPLALDCIVNGLPIGIAPLTGTNGLVLGTYQSDNINFPNGNGYQGIVQGFPFSIETTYINTNDVDYQTGLSVNAPTLRADQAGNVFGDMRAWDVFWNGSNFNQGSPKPDGSMPSYGLVGTLPVTGSYDNSSGDYVIRWRSTIIGGSFNGFTGRWQLVGALPAGQNPTHTPPLTNTNTPTSTPTFTNTSTPTSTPTFTNTNTRTSTPTFTNTNTPTSTPTFTNSPTSTPTPVSACAAQWPVAVVWTYGKVDAHETSTTNTTVTQGIVGNIIDPGSYSTTADKVNLCKGTFVRVFIFETGGNTPTVITSSRIMECNIYNQCDINSLTARVKYTAYASDGTDKDRITLIPK